MKWCIYVAPKIFYFQNWIKFSEGLIFFFYRSMKKRRKCGNVNCAKSKVSMTIDFEPVSKKAQKWSKPSLIKHTRYVLQFQKNGPMEIVTVNLILVIYILLFSKCLIFCLLFWQITSKNPIFSEITECRWQERFCLLVFSNYSPF